MATRYCDLDALSNGDGSIGSPWDSLAAMQTGCTSGDTINIKGTQTITSVFYWDSGKAATWQLWSGETCTITVSGGSFYGGICVQIGVVTFSGLTFTTSGERDGGWMVVHLGTSSSIVQNCYFQNCAGTAIYVRLGLTGGVISGNTITDGAGGHGIWLNGTAAVYNNYIKTIGGSNDGIFIQEGADGSDIYGNYIEANSAKSDIIVRGGVTSHLSGVKIHENYLCGTNTVSGIDIDASGSTEYELQDIWVYNNIFVNKHQGADNDSYGVIRVNAPYSRTDVSPIRIYNNSISLKGSDTAGEVFKACIILYCINTADYIDIQNNIARVEDTDANGYSYCILVNGTTTHVTEDYGYYYSSEANVITGTDIRGAHTVSGTDPLFTDNASNLAIRVESGARDAGVDLAAYFTTGLMAGATWPTPTTVTRPIGAAWDIGACEYAGGDPPDAPFLKDLVLVLK